VVKQQCPQGGFFSRPSFIELLTKIGFWTRVYPITSSLDEFMNIVEKKILDIALEEANFEKSKAAGLLGITFRSFRYKIEKIGIESNGEE